MAEEWFYAREGQQFGPVAAPQLKQLAATGQLQGTDLVWKPGMAQWVQASQLKGLLGGSADQRALPQAVRNTGNDATVPVSGNVQAPPEPTLPAPSPFDAVAAVAPTINVGEPWYYGFIDGYTKLFLMLGLGAATLAFLLFLGVSLMSLTRAEGGFAVILAIGSMLAGLVFVALWVLGLMFTAALFLLAVDAGRNLRAVRKNTGG